ncbi:MAG: 4Fe-4S dicluster domain-containing protein [Deltaproteobacteria bacterium]|nr:4Fe-4S dicluster domain-containing protein [Deltaproteobacteria bacterium]
MSEDIYRTLQQRLDQYSMGFPATESGIEIRILRYLFSEQDAALFLALSPALETPEAVAARLGRPLEDVAGQLEDMALRGLLFRLEKKGTVKYGAIPFVHGLFEFQVKNLSPDLALMMEQYEKEGFDRALQDSGGYFLRTIPIQRAVDTTQHIAAYEDAVTLLRQKDLIVITDCICRKRTEVMGQSCGKPMEACFMFGSMGQYYLDRDMGRKIDVEEAIAILTQCQEAGLVTQPATSQNPSGLCNCCGDCCGVLRALNRHPKPAEIIFSNYYARVEEEECLGCAVCLDRCQMQALSLNDEGLAQVNGDRCIGCGLCVTTCPSGAMQLIPKAADQIRVPPASSAEQMMRLAQVRIK